MYEVFVCVGDHFVIRGYFGGVEVDLFDDVCDVLVGYDGEDGDY